MVAFLSVHARVIAASTEKLSSYRTIIIAQALKGLDFDGWDGSMERSGGIPGCSIATLNEHLKIRLQRVPGYYRQWKIDHSFRFHFDRPVSTSSGLVFTLTQQEFRDQSTRRYTAGLDPQSSIMPSFNILSGSDFQAVGATDYKTGSAYLGVGTRFVTENGIKLEGLLGPVYDRRGGISQDGVKYDMRFQFATDSIAWDGAGWFSHFGAGDDHFIHLQANGAYGLSDAANDRFSAIYSAGTRREFSPTDSRIGRRDDKRVEVDNNLIVTIPEFGSIGWNSNLTNRLVESRSPASIRSDREFNWSNNLTSDWSAPGRFVTLGGGIDVQQQEYAGGLTQGRNSRMQLVAGFNSPPADTSVAEINVSRYRFDTPDLLDHNDRDELRWMFALRSGVRLTKAVALKGGVEANLNHLVYLHRSRSGENRWTRQFTFYTEVPWKEYPLENRTRFAVSAHYTDYDFLPYEVLHSRVFRTFTATDTFRLMIDRDWGFEMSCQGQLDDNGKLNWTDWIENVSERGYSYTITTLPYRKTDASEVALGWLIYRRVNNFIGNASGKTSEEVASYGPISRINLFPNKHISAEFTATYLTITKSGRQRLYLPDVNFTLTWFM